MDGFIKAEGLGNDFIVLDRRELATEGVEQLLAKLPSLAPSWCDRRRGIGADGILLIGPGSPGVDAQMWVINFDGSRPEMCGNGLRCVAGYLASHTGASALRIRTDAGALACLIEAAGTEMWQVTVDMGAPEDLGTVTPAAADRRTFRAVSMGNPHAVAFVDGSEDPEALALRLGPIVEIDRLFPNRTNVEFARLTGERSIDLWVWERGVGLTQACGTGACATACAAAWAGLVPSGQPIEVRLPGGPLTIWTPTAVGEPVRMRGPARCVFEGRLPRM